MHRSGGWIGNGRWGAVLVVAALVVFLLTGVGGLQFELSSGDTKCISEEIKINAMSVGKYTVVVPNQEHSVPDTHKLTVKVSSPHGSIVHHGDRVDSGNFAFTSWEAGDYMACFDAPGHKPSTMLTVDFEWKTGVAAKDWSNVAKKGQIDAMEIELKKLEDTVKSIHDEMFYLREREEEMQDLNRTTNYRMAWLSFLSLVICLSVSGFQLWHLKSFFERKKLL